MAQDPEDKMNEQLAREGQAERDKEREEREQIRGEERPDKVERVRRYNHGFEDDYDDRRPRRRRVREDDGEAPQQTMIQRLMPIIVSVVFSVVIIMFWAGSNLVSRDDFTKNISNVANDVGTLKTSMTAMQKSIDSLSGITQQVNNISTQVGQINTKISQVSEAQSQYAKTTALDGISASITDAKNNIASVQRDINTLKDSVASVKGSIPDTASLTSSINSVKATLQSNIDTLNSTLTTYKGIVDGLRRDVDALKSTTTTTLNISSFTPNYGVAGTVVVINGTGFINVTSVIFGGVLASGFTVNSSTQITATVGSGATGLVVVNTSTGSISTSGTAGTFTYSTSGGTTGGNVTCSIVGGNTLAFVTSGTTVNVSLSNGLSKAVYAEQVSLTLQFLSPPTPITGWGLLINGVAGNPSYSIVSGIVSYVVDFNAYITPSATQTVSIMIQATNPPATTVNFVATVSIAGYSALP